MHGGCLRFSKIVSQSGADGVTGTERNLMRLKIIATALLVAGAIAFVAAPADAAAKKKRAVVTGSGRTVFVSRDEDGRTRTKIIIQKRSYLDPGPEQFPGENLGN